MEHEKNALLDLESRLSFEDRMTEAADQLYPREVLMQYGLTPGDISSYVYTFIASANGTRPPHPRQVIIDHVVQKAAEVKDLDTKIDLTKAALRILFSSTFPIPPGHTESDQSILIGNVFQQAGFPMMQELFGIDYLSGFSRSLREYWATIVEGNAIEKALVTGALALSPEEIDNFPKLFNVASKIMASVYHHRRPQPKSLQGAMNALLSEKWYREYWWDIASEGALGQIPSYNELTCDTLTKSLILLFKLQYAGIAFDIDQFTKILIEEGVEIEV